MLLVSVDRWKNHDKLGLQHEISGTANNIRTTRKPLTQTRCQILLSIFAVSSPVSTLKPIEPSADEATSHSIHSVTNTGSPWQTGDWWRKPNDSGNETCVSHCLRMSLLARHSHLWLLTVALQSLAVFSSADVARHTEYGPEMNENILMHFYAELIGYPVTKGTVCTLLDRNPNSTAV